MPLDFARIKGICFDIDGTLSDTDDQAVAACAKLVRPLTLIFRRMDHLHFARKLIMAAETPGNLLYTIPDMLGLDDELMWVMERLARWSNKKPGFMLINRAAELLATLEKRYPLAVVSARNQYGTMQFLEQFQLAPFFRTIVTSQTCKHTKPYPDPILFAAEKLGVRPYQLLMVGDTTVDILAARRAGAQSVGVLCGFGEAAELQRAGADLILDHTSDLLACFEEPDPTVNGGAQ